ncbi:hypothetical protein CANCADRAFT_2217 [Tortispora caseinolytica NRRL Y-17796]|uniref:Uncharacterized protein n=1 Tax=Tortispora caseinolytica NRRL Y-17796 TaxID=767744 RepID=A0A1E4TFF5_9ASCO|nr:hypothetical protein CANCADRAFT_2217 [Tortispora caseinolytica NRRL Y-17796]
MSPCIPLDSCEQKVSCSHSADTLPVASSSSTTTSNCQAHISLKRRASAELTSDSLKVQRNISQFSQSTSVCNDDDLWSRYVSGSSAFPLRNPCAPTDPPISVDSLSELDSRSMFFNPQVRHDLAFDSGLRFRPADNAAKQKHTRDFWEAMVDDCTFLNNYDSVSSSNSASGPVSSGPVSKRPMSLLMQTRIPISLITFFEVFHSVVDSDYIAGLQNGTFASLSRYMAGHPVPPNDPALEQARNCINQLQYRSFDFLSFVEGIVSRCKQHCAPLRDELLDIIVQTSREAYSVLVPDTRKLVDVFEMLYSILEIMKLDAANHTLHILRPVLLEAVTQFEEDYFTVRLSAHPTDRYASFYKECLSANKLGVSVAPNNKSFGPLTVSRGIIDFLRYTPDNVKSLSDIPLSLSLDAARIKELRRDVRCYVLSEMAYEAAQIFGSSAANKDILIELLSEGHKFHRKEIAKIVDGPRATTEFVNDWVHRNLHPSSKLYQKFEEYILKRILKQTLENLQSFGDSAKSGSGLPANWSTIADTNEPVWSLGSISSRLAQLAVYNWTVFRRLYRK